MIILKRGSRGPDVERLQSLLRSKSVPPLRLSIDGDFGEKTESAVRLYQQQKALRADGVVGPQTWLALNQVVSKVQDSGASADKVDIKNKKDWMKVAEAEIGVSEYSTKDMHNSRIVEYHQTTSGKFTDDETPWCSSFVNWVMKQSGYAGTGNALARSWLNWGSELSEPVYGAVTVIKKIGKKTDSYTGSTTGFHVGFLIEETKERVRLLGGNQSDSVKYSNFKKEGYEVKGYRLPK